MKTLRETLPKASKIKPTYVHANSSKADLALPMTGATISVLGPERDIDFYYLGDRAIRRCAVPWDSSSRVLRRCPRVSRNQRLSRRRRISIASDFRQLRSRMLSTALAFADLDGKVCNNTSVVILLEWKGKRLLFVGDAESDGGSKRARETVPGT